MTVEAGVILEEAHQAAEAAGAMFPLWIACQGSARIGGVLVSNAGGVQVLAFGNARELSLGVEAVLADGRLYQRPQCAEEGQYRLRPQGPAGRRRGHARHHHRGDAEAVPDARGARDGDLSMSPSPEAALELFYLLRERTGSRLTAFELMPRFGIDLQLKHGMLARDPTASLSPWYALVEVNRMKGGVPGALQAALEEALGAGPGRRRGGRRVRGRPRR